MKTSTCRPCGAAKKKGAFAPSGAKITAMDVVNNKEGKPLEFYLEKFKEMDPAEMAARCGLPYDGEARTITMNLLGEHFSVSHPDYTIVGPTPLTNAERILFLRYLLDCLLYTNDPADDSIRE
ncbi:MAG: DUF3786 domain-containing protein, partial [Oscillospiraceae bacterium]|nr:DUF3786 domain-containing protein [Oscillospiraceae bacterium]